MSTPTRAARATAAWLWLACAVPAQVTNELDFDTTQLPVATVPPNGSTHTISASTTFVGQHLELHAPLLVPSGVELRLERSILKVFGDIRIEDGGRLSVIDSDLLMPCQYQLQYRLWVVGGLLHTERAVIGGGRVGSQLYWTTILLLRGTWLARQTVLQATGVTLSSGRTGFGGNPLWKGGSLFADGLWEGDSSDAIQMSGVGDATLANGTMNVALYYDAGANPAPASVTFDMDSRSWQNIVYGDPAVHAGVTAPLPLHPCRLELRNHRSPWWVLFAVNVSTSGPLQTLTLENAEDIGAAFSGTDIVGSPVLGGPWSTHYSRLPGLPSTALPGHHAIPPSCSVRLGNAMFRSGSAPTAWNRVRSWGLYASGPGNDVSITGPTSISEIILRGGTMTLSGSDSYDMNIACQKVELRNAANLQMSNVSLGRFGIYAGSTGLIDAGDASTCTVTTARAGRVRLRTTNAAAITVQNVVGRENLLPEAIAGTVALPQAAPTQNTDLQNADFEAPLLAGNVPPYWLAQAVTGSLVTDPSPGSPGNRSYETIVQSSSTSLQKMLTLPRETFVTVIGAAKVVQPPASGNLFLQTSQGTTVASKATNLATAGWQRLHVPSFTVAPGGAPTLVKFAATGSPATVRLDDVRAAIGSWWDIDNLGNLDFELGYRGVGRAPHYWTPPDAWGVYHMRCDASTIVRPGAAPGSQSNHGTLTDAGANAYKVLTFPRAGDVLVFSGWVRGVAAAPGTSMSALAGDGPGYAAIGVGNNQLSPPMPCDGAWHPFTLTYTVPQNPVYTRLDLYMGGKAGDEFWCDDITVEIR